MAAKKNIETAKKVTGVVKTTAAAKVAETVKPAAAKAEPVKAEAVKAAAPAKAEAVKAAEKAPAKKAPAKKPATKKAAAEKVEHVYVQFAGKELLTTELLDQAKKAWEAEGHRASSIKSLELYVKPEDNAAYYVINGKETGKIEL